MIRILVVASALLLFCSTVMAGNGENCLNVKSLNGDVQYTNICREDITVFYCSTTKRLSGKSCGEGTKSNNPYYTHVNQLKAGEYATSSGDKYAVCMGYLNDWLDEDEEKFSSNNQGDYRCDGTPLKNEPKDLWIESGKQWQNSGHIADGINPMTIKYVKGKWSSNPSGQRATYGGEGWGGRGGSSYVLPGAPEGGLIAKVGGRVFLVGRGPTTVPEGLRGPIYLAINDDWSRRHGAGLTDNTGRILVKIETGQVQKRTDTHASLLLLIDTSGSMGGDKIREAKSAAKKSIKRALQEGVEVSIMSFAGDCSNPIKLQIPFTTDSNRLLKFIDSLKAEGGTPLSAALRSANNYMYQAKGVNSGMQMIVLLADGANSCGSITAVLDEFRNKNVVFRHETIGLEISPGSEAAQQLKTIAKRTGGGYHYASNHTQLANVFMDAVSTMQMLDMLGEFSKTKKKQHQTNKKQNSSNKSFNSILDSL